MKKIVVFFLCIFIFSSCSSPSFSSVIQGSEYLFGTLVSIKVYNSNESDKDIINDCFSMIAEYEHIFSYSESDSELSLLNLSAYNNPVAVSRELFDIINQSLVYCAKTNGAFDIGLGRLIEIWDKASYEGIPPDTALLSDFVGFKGYEFIILDDDKKTVMYTDERVAVHLGACAKGYVEDRVIEFLKERGVESAVVDFGGSVAVIGDKNGNPFVVGIINPDDENTLIGNVGISDSCVVTSGDYRRYFMYNNVRYHHILDSATACPAISDINSVSVVSTSAFKGDCLSTAAFVSGLETACQLITSENCGYVIITDYSVETSGVILNE